MSLSMFPAWLLDQCATTDEAVAMLREQNFTISGLTFDSGTVSTLHWGITDETGKSAMIEFTRGNLNIYEGQDIPVLTNDPNFPQMECHQRLLACQRGDEHPSGHRIKPRPFRESLFLRPSRRKDRRF